MINWRDSTQGAMYIKQLSNARIKILSLISNRNFTVEKKSLICGFPYLIWNYCIFIHMVVIQGEKRL